MKRTVRQKKGCRRRRKTTITYRQTRGESFEIWQSLLSRFHFVCCRERRVSVSGVHSEKKNLTFCLVFFPCTLNTQGSRQTTSSDCWGARQEKKKTTKNVRNRLKQGLVFNGIGDSEELYPKHWNVRTLDGGSHPPHLQEAHSSLLWPPIPDRLPALPPGRQGAPRWVFSLESQGLLLVPRPRSHITGPSLSKNKPTNNKKNVLFSTCLPWLLWSHTVSACLLCFSFLFLLLLVAQNVFIVLKKKSHGNVVSLMCAWREKRNKTH